AQQEIQNQHRLQQKLMQQAKKYGFQLIPITQNSMWSLGGSGPSRVGQVNRLAGAEAQLILLALSARLKRLRKKSMGGAGFPKNHPAGVKTPTPYCPYRHD
ncbi:MAG: hypothetical protein WBE74_01990, partial [Terracidiphilus sp.]